MKWQTTHIPKLCGAAWSMSVCVGVLLPYQDGTYAAELFLLLITAVAAAIQIRLGQFLITY